MTPCACGHPRAAHTAPDQDCRSCPPSDPCEGWEPAPAPITDPETEECMP